MIKRTFTLLSLIAALMLSVSLSYAQDSDMKEGTSDEPVGTAVEGGMLFGEEFKSGEAITFAELIANKDDYKDKEVLVKGSVSDVCQKMGCWLVITGADNEARITTGHKFFVPKNSSGKEALVYGKFSVTELSEEDAKHYNEESSNPKDNVEGSKESYEIVATGIIFMDN